MAGAVIGVGINLNIGLFSLAVSLLTIGVCSLLGAVVGYAVARLLSDEVTLMEKMAAVPHRLLSHEQRLPPYDHRSLRQEMRNKPIAEREVVEIIHSVRTAGILPMTPRPSDARVLDLVASNGRR